MRDYTNYNAEELLEDDYFLEWMRNDHEETNRWWESWLAGNAEKQSVVAEARLKYQLLVSFKKTKTSQQEAERSWEHIIRAIEQPRRKTRPVRMLWMGAAAACIALLMIFTFYRYAGKGTETIITATTEIKQVKLDDGSLVTLNKGGTLKLYSNVNRQIWLEGEAYFEVSKIKDPAGHKIKFIVHAGDFNVKVTGTSFMVTNSTTEKNVMLVEGRVLLDANGKETPLMPGDRATLDHGQLSMEKVNTAAFAAWKAHEFKFENTSLHDLKILVASIYGMELIIKKEGQLKYNTLNGTVNTDSKENFIKTIAILLNANITNVNNQLIIEPKP